MLGPPQSPRQRGDPAVVARAAEQANLDRQHEADHRRRQYATAHLAAPSSRRPDANLGAADHRDLDLRLALMVGTDARLLGAVTGIDGVGHQPAHAESKPARAGA